jgi:predicted ATPase
MLESRFIGREAELLQLRELAIHSKDKRGGVLFIEAPAGMGTSTLLKEFEDRAHRDLQLSETVFIGGECEQFTGTESAYHPFIEILEAFGKPENKGRQIAEKAISIIRDSAQDWLDILPVIGPTIKAVVKTAARASDLALSSGSKTQADKGIALTHQYVDTILKIASTCSLLVLVIFDAQWIDTSSCQLLMRLGRVAQKHNLLLIVTCSPEYMNEQHPLRTVRAKMLIENIADMITLSGCSIDEIRTYLRATFGDTFNPHLAEWLRDLCNGEPWFIIQYLSLLRRHNIIDYTAGKYKLNGQIKRIAGEWVVEDQIKNVLPSGKIEELLKMRISGLQKAERQILEIGAVQGKRFMSVVLARLLSKENHEIIRYLLEIEQQHQLISRCTDDEWARIRSDVYTFVVSLMQQIMYNKLPPEDRSDYHSDIAKILQDILKNILDKNPQPNQQLNLIIQIAHHYDLGKEPLLAAHYYLQAAQSSFYAGALKETSELCQRALEKVHSLPEGISDYDKLRAEIIQLKLTASEMWWRGKSEYNSGRSEEEDLVEEAEAAAFRTGNRSLLARIKYIRGKMYITTRTLQSAVEVLKEAIQMAHDAQDPLAEFFIMAELGYRIIGHDIDKTLDFGLDLQYKAHNLFENHLRMRPDLMPNMNRHLYQLKGRIGVGEFDRGNYGHAIKWLQESIRGLKEQKRIEELSWSLNFLSQVYTAIGLFEDAEKVLQEAISLQKDEEPIAARGYNLAFLGKLYLEWGRISDSEKPLLDGWEETQRVWMVAIVPLVRTYYAELLMHPNYKGRDL